MISSDFRTEARRALDGKWGKAVLMTFAYALVFFVLELIVNLLGKISMLAILFNIISFVIEIPLTFGLISCLFKLYKGESVATFDFISIGFSNFGKSWGMSLRMILKLIVPIIIFILSISLIIYAGINCVDYQVTNAQYQDINMALSNGSLTDTGAVLVLIGFIFMFVSSIWMTVKSYYYQLTFIVAADDNSLTSAEAIDRSEKLMTGKRAKLFWLELSFIGWAILTSFTLGIGYFWLIPYMLFATFSFYFFAVKDNEKTASNNEKTE